MSGGDESGGVAGERTTARVEQARSLHSRLSNLLALGLMSVLGLGALTWYYANAMSRQDRSRRSAQATASARAQGDMVLPSLGRIEAPPIDSRASLPAPPEPSPPSPITLSEIPLNPYAPPPNSNTSAAPVAKSAAELAQERRLSGVVFAGSAVGRGSVAATPASANEVAVGPLGAAPWAAYAPGIAAAAEAPAPAPEPGNLAPLLRAHVAAAVPAQILSTRRLLLPKGAFIDCTLETAIDSTLPGMTTCVLATDTFGADGKVVLLERGTKLTGETRGQVQQGAARVFVLWSEARTPAGVIVPLDSPGADELGRAGLPGEVNHHFWERFGAAILVSVIDGAVQAGVQSSGRGSTSIELNPSPTQDIMGEVLKSTSNIPPTVVKRNGDRIQVLVARDLDFRPVYELRAAARR